MIAALFGVAALAVFVAMLFDLRLGRPRGTRIATGVAWPRRRGVRTSRAALPGLVDALAGALGSGVSLPIAFAEILHIDAT